MESQVVINWLFAAAGAMGSFILKATWDAVVTLRKDLSELQGSIAETYVRRDDFALHAARIETLLHEIRDDLKRKIDRDSFRIPNHE